MDSRASIDGYFLAMLDLVSNRSTCRRRNVGAIITDERGIVLGMGYNGVPRGFPHCNIYPCEGAHDQPGNTQRCMAVHAEQNALLQCHDLDRARVMYCSTTPCFTCAKMIANTRIKRVRCLQAYSDPLGIAVLQRAGIDLEYPWAESKI